mmetsp:Transcript_15735/g.61453  ORF Transcript_15735/g.61453 Transcript_15735/m.61453 type:complete len:311 (-) Transcript_15735:36-968(-)
MEPEDHFEQYEPTDLEDVPRPASQKAVDSLASVSGATAEGEQCSVCHSTFNAIELLKKLPCNHCFHEDCVLRWLKEHHTCPLCRYEMEAEPLPRDTAGGLGFDQAAMDFANNFKPIMAALGSLGRTDLLRSTLEAMNVEMECWCDDCMSHMISSMIPPETVASYMRAVEPDQRGSAAPFNFSYGGTPVARNWSCAECHLTFGSADEEEFHRTRCTYHVEELPEKQCNYCGAMCSNVQSLLLHSALAHQAPVITAAPQPMEDVELDPAGPYDRVRESKRQGVPICPHCHRTFSDENAYKVHLQLLSPVAPF